MGTPAGISSRMKLPFIFLLASAFVFAACKKETSAPKPPPKVTVARAVVREVNDWDEYTGRLEATKVVEVRARVSGYLNTIHFKDGQMVKAGDPLFVIDPRPYQAEANLRKADVERAQSRYALQQVNLRRAEGLNQGNVISKQDLDQRQSEAAVAAADLAGAKAALEAAQLNLEFTSISATIGGRVSRRLVDEGNLVVGGSTQAATLLTNIVPLDPLYVLFDVDERAVLRYTHLFEQGQRTTSRNAPNPVQVAFADEKDYPHAGRMDFVDNRLDPDTGTLRGRAIIDNPTGNLTPGLFVRLRLKGRDPFQALLVPDEAIGTDQSRRFVLVVNDKKVVEKRYVTPGRLYDNLRAVPEGIKPDEWIVVKGIQRARPGEPVNPEGMNEETGNAPAIPVVIAKP